VLAPNAPAGEMRGEESGKVDIGKTGIELEEIVERRGKRLNALEHMKKNKLAV